MIRPGAVPDAERLRGSRLLAVADVAFWEQTLTAKGWGVNPPGDVSGDRRNIFIPEGAQFVAKFSLFYYRIYEGGGNGQFEFECLKQ